MSDIDPFAITPNQLARLMRVSRQTLWLWRRHKGLPSYTIHADPGVTIVRFRLSEVIDWYLENKNSLSEKVVHPGLTLSLGKEGKRERERVRLRSTARA